MFRTGYILLTILTVFIHALLGCCAHHDHHHGFHLDGTCEHHQEMACESNHSESECQQDRDLDSTDLHSESKVCDHSSVVNGNTEEEHQNHGHDHSPCGESDCQFVSVARSGKVTDSWTVFLFDVRSYRNSTIDLDSIAQAERPQEFTDGPFFSNEPLHRLKQVWLL